MRLEQELTRPALTMKLEASFGEDLLGACPDFHFAEREEPEKIAATLVKLVQGPNLFFSPEPVLDMVAVPFSMLLVQLVCATADFVFNVEGGILGFHDRR